MSEPEDIPNPCPTKQSLVVKFAFTEAKRRLQRAKRALSEFVKRPDNPRSKVTKDSLARNFLWTEDIRKGGNFIGPDVTKDFLPKVMDQLLQNIDKPKVSECYSNSEYKDPNDPEINALNAKSPYVNTNHFLYTPAFFSKNRTSQARIIIHEMCHSWAGMPGFNEIYRFQKGYPPRTGVAVNNADCYAFLIIEIS